MRISANLFLHKSNENTGKYIKTIFHNSRNELKPCIALKNIHSVKMTKAD